MTRRDGAVEVHPPEHGIHSWRDFFVHMGTICLGLLIAIGLEQSVEWLHHRHQRHELQEAIRGDVEQMVADSELTNRTAQEGIDWMQSQIVASQAAIDQKTKVNLRPRPSGGAYAPIQDPAFRAAKAGGLLPLLPQDEIRVLSNLDGLADTEERFWENLEAAASHVNEFRVRFGDPGAPANRWSTADPTDLARYIQALAVQQATLRQVAFISREAHDASVQWLRGDHDSRVANFTAEK